MVLDSVIAFASRHQRRFARLVLLGGVVYGALELWPNWPRETEVEFALGATHAEVVELRVAYSKDGQALHGVTFNFPSGAPSSVRHRVTLPAGTVLLQCEVRARAGTAREVTRTLRTPHSGPVLIPLEGSRPTALGRVRPGQPRART